MVDKLEEATLAARLDRSLQRNVEALKAVQPEKLGPSPDQRQARRPVG